MPKLSYALKIYMGLFLTVDKALLDAPSLWRKHYSTGKIRITIVKKGRGILILEDFGDLSKSKNVQVREIKCTFKGAPYHEYLITWE